MKNICIVLLLCVTFSVTQGCSNSADSLAVAVTGEVYLNEKPFTGAAVRFYNPQLGGGAFNLNEQGKFESNDSLAPGEYMVSLDRPGPNTGESPADISWPDDNTASLPKQYLLGSQSGLSAQVSEMGDNHFVFNIKGPPPSSSRSGREGPQVFQPLAGGTQ